VNGCTLAKLLIAGDSKNKELPVEDDALKNEYEITIDGELAVVPHKEVSFAEVVAIAYPVPPSPDTTFTVTFRKAEEPREGDLVAGQVVVVKKKGTIFDVTPTGKS
jgi:hypothetical protein